MHKKKLLEDLHQIINSLLKTVKYRVQWFYVNLVYDWNILLDDAVLMHWTLNLNSSNNTLKFSCHKHAAVQFKITQCSQYILVIKDTT